MTKTLNQDQLELLARLSQGANRSPAEYEAMLRALPEHAKRAFVEIDAETVRERCQQSLQKKLRGQPAMARFLKDDDRAQIVEQNCQNIFADQAMVREMLAKSTSSEEQGVRQQVVHR